MTKTIPPQSPVRIGGNHTRSVTYKIEVFDSETLEILYKDYTDIGEVAEIILDRARTFANNYLKE
jgi:hypothetical protein